MGFLLVQVEGHEDKRHVFTDVFQIGRHPYVEVQLEDPLVASLHATVYRDGDDWAVRQIAGNGITINGMRIPMRKLFKGDRIGVGLTTLIVVPG